VNFRSLLLVLLLPGFPLMLEAQSLVINEVMSSNSITVADEDGDYPDWLELFNSGSGTADLSGYWLSDDNTIFQKWQFGDVEIGPESFLLVFASDKDRQGSVEHWNTVIDRGDEWRYMLPDEQPDEAWKTLEFDDSDWLVGETGIGYGDDDDETIIDHTVSMYTRNQFQITDMDIVLHAILHIDFDDAFVAYLNGEEIARDNIGDPGNEPGFEDEAEDDGFEARMYEGGLPHRYDIDDAAELLREGDNILAIQVHNLGSESSDMSFIPFLTLQQENSSGITPPPLVLQLSGSSIHTNFKIKSAGESLFLSDPSGEPLDSLFTGVLTTDVSIGRKPDGDPNWVYFHQPTPGGSNISMGSDTLITGGVPVFSHAAGFYLNGIDLELAADMGGATIYYTTDGSIPSESSEEYTGPILMNNSAVIRARTFIPGLFQSPVVTNSYLINEPSQLPVFSITSPPDEFWPIYNWRHDDETEAHIEFFEADGVLAFEHDVGVEVFGSGSSGFEQKSLSIFFRSIYDVGELSYNIFPELPFEEYESILLRNGGNDWWSTLIRDPLSSNGLMEGTNLDYQEYRSSKVYINGEFWGIYNLREKVNEHFLKDHHFVDEEDLDLLQYKELVTPEIIHGDLEHYDHLIDYLDNHNLAYPQDYEYVQTLIDIDNYIDYQIIEIYSTNIDWPANNNKFWRPRHAGGKWRWILFDTDTGYSLWDEEAWKFDHIEHATNSGGSLEEGWPNPRWSTYIFRKLLENPDFKHDFINRFADYLNTRFSAENALEKVVSFHAGISSELPAHLERWDRSQGDYNGELNKVKTFVQERPKFVRRHLISNFDLEDTITVSISIEPPDAGVVKFNSMLLEDDHWQGIYFTEAPIRLSASPHPGYIFKEWLGSDVQGQTITPYPSAANDIVALFEADTGGTLVINEINYKSGPLSNPRDWFELFNNSPGEITLTGWTLEDRADTNIYAFPQNTRMESGDYLVVCRDLDQFTAAFPDVENVIGSFAFGLSDKGDAIKIFDESNQIVDSLTYWVDTLSWSGIPDGNGPTLELINPYSDNALPLNWSASDRFGTPGKQNSRYDITHVFDPDTSFIPDTSITPPPEEPDTTISLDFEDMVVYPNPFVEYTHIRYKHEDWAQVKISIYNLLGQEVSIPVIGYHNGKERDVTWYAVSDDGEPLAKGIYLCAMSLDSKVKAVRKILIL